jgi:hypothetical protein
MAMQSDFRADAPLEYEHVFSTRHPVVNAQTMPPTTKMAEADFPLGIESDYPDKNTDYHKDIVACVQNSMNKYLDIEAFLDHTEIPPPFNDGKKWNFHDERHIEPHRVHVGFRHNKLCVYTLPQTLQEFVYNLNNSLWNMQPSRKLKATPIGIASCDVKPGGKMIRPNLDFSWNNGVDKGNWITPSAPFPVAQMKSMTRIVDALAYALENLCSTWGGAIPSKVSREDWQSIAWYMVGCYGGWDNKDVGGTNTHTFDSFEAGNTLQWLFLPFSDFFPTMGITPTSLGASSDSPANRKKAGEKLCKLIRALFTANALLKLASEQVGGRSAKFTLLWRQGSLYTAAERLEMCLRKDIDMGGPGQPLTLITPTNRGEDMGYPWPVYMKEASKGNKAPKYGMTQTQRNLPWGTAHADDGVLNTDLSVPDIKAFAVTCDRGGRWSTTITNKMPIQMGQLNVNSENRANSAALLLSYMTCMTKTPDNAYAWSLPSELHCHSGMAHLIGTQKQCVPTPTQSKVSWNQGNGVRDKKARGSKIAPGFMSERQTKDPVRPDYKEVAKHGDNPENRDKEGGGDTELGSQPSREMGRRIPEVDQGSTTFNPADKTPGYAGEITSAKTGEKIPVIRKKGESKDAAKSRVKDSPKHQP